MVFFSVLGDVLVKFKSVVRFVSDILRFCVLIGGIICVVFVIKVMCLFDMWVVIWLMIG